MDDQKNPKCPYCGHEMNLGYDGKGMTFGRCYFYCDCGAQAPSACVEYATPDDWIGIEEKAYWKATERPMQKPMALEDITGTILLIPCWVELKKRYAVPRAEILDRDSRDIYRRSDQEYLPANEYGRKWRAWAKYPSHEERAAAEWIE